MNITKALDLRHCFCIDVNALIYAELKIQICINFEEKKLNKIGVDGFKIASGELSNHPMLNFISGTKKYIFLSTGMSNWKEINDAMKIFRENKKKS